MFSLSNVNSHTKYEISLYKFFVENKLNKWEELIRQMEIEYNKTEDEDFLYKLTYAQYGYIGYCIAQSKIETGKAVHRAAEKNIKKLIDESPSKAELYALKGALKAYAIEFDKINMIKHGLASMEWINKAYEKDKQNPLVLMEKGNMTYYIPSFLGGGIDNAIEYHETSIHLFENNLEKLEYNWIYLLVAANLGRWHEENNNIRQAKEVYEKILDHEPNYKWVKDELYPGLLRNMNYKSD